MNIVKKRIALRNRVKSFEVVKIEPKDPSKQLYYTTPGVAEELEDILNRDGAMKAQVTLHVTFKKKKIEYRDDGQAEEVFEYKDAYFNSTAFSILNENQIIEVLDKAAEEINNKIAFWLSEGSGWTIVEIRSHFVNIVKYLPLRGNSYIPTPEELRHHNKGLTYPKNIDNKRLFSLGENFTFLLGTGWSNNVFSNDLFLNLLMRFSIALYIAYRFFFKL